jgi:hypothetical protein
MWLRSQRLQRLIGGTVFERMAIGFASRVELMRLSGHKEPETLRLIRTVRRERKSMVTANEAFLVHALARAQSRQPGDMAEVGVFEGATARIICEAKGDKTLHLYDTFDGLPEPAEFERRVHRAKMFACSLDSVKQYLAGYNAVVFYKGRFPETADAARDKRFSFVHLDVDLYESTRACFEFFYPRMVPGGIMLSHDYSILAGVRKAVDEFAETIPEEPVELPTTQCMIVRSGLDHAS